MPAARPQATPEADAADHRSSSLTEGAGAAAVAAVSAVGFPAAAARRAAAEPRGAGDGVWQRRLRSRRRHHSRGGETHLRTDRLRLGAHIVKLRLHPDPVGERAGAHYSMAAHL